MLIWWCLEKMRGVGRIHVRLRAWRKRLWNFTHPWETAQVVRCRKHTTEAIAKHAECHVVPFSGWEVGGSSLPRWWEGPPAPTRVLFDPAASPPPMCDEIGAGFGFSGGVCFLKLVLHLASACVWQIHHGLCGFVIVVRRLVKEKSY